MFLNIPNRFNEAKRTNGHSKQWRHASISVRKFMVYSDVKRKRDNAAQSQDTDHIFCSRMSVSSRHTTWLFVYRLPKPEDRLLNVEDPQQLAYSETTPGNNSMSPDLLIRVVFNQKLVQHTVWARKASGLRAGCISWDRKSGTWFDMSGHRSARANLNNGQSNRRLNDSRSSRKCCALCNDFPSSGGKRHKPELPLCFQLLCPHIRLSCMLQFLIIDPFDPRLLLPRNPGLEMSLAKCRSQGAPSTVESANFFHSFWCKHQQTPIGFSDLRHSWGPAWPEHRMNARRVSE